MENHFYDYRIIKWGSCCYNARVYMSFINVNNVQSRSITGSEMTYANVTAVSGTQWKSPNRCYWGINLQHFRRAKSIVIRGPNLEADFPQVDRPDNTELFNVRTWLPIEGLITMDGGSITDVLRAGVLKEGNSNVLILSTF